VQAKHAKARVVWTPKDSSRQVKMIYRFRVRQLAVGQ
jgi:hypothetical protein